jgi:hypothetical protein
MEYAKVVFYLVLFSFLAHAASVAYMLSKGNYGRDEGRRLLPSDI